MHDDVGLQEVAVELGRQRSGWNPEPKLGRQANQADCADVRLGLGDEGGSDRVRRRKEERSEGRKPGGARRDAEEYPPLLQGHQKD